MATVKGTVSQNKSKYKFYIEYTTTFNASTMKWTVKCTSYLEVDHYAYEGNTSHSLYIGGTKVASKSDYKKSCYSNSGVKSFQIATATRTYAASTSARSVKLTAKMTAPSGGYGPGSCSVTKTISLPAKLSSAGEMSIASVTSHGCKVSATKLATGLGYTRTVKFYYKLSSASAWTLLGSDSVSSSESSASCTVNGLLPGRGYSFKYEVYAPDKSLMKTCTGSATTLKDTFTLSLSKKTETTVAVKVSGLDGNVGYTRTLRGYYKKKTDTTWTKASPVLTLSATTTSTSVTYTFTGLTAGVAYEFYIACLYSSTELGRATFATTTVVVEPEIPYEFTVEVTTQELVITVEDNISPYFNGHAAIYIRGQDDDSYYYLGLFEVVCGSNVSANITVAISDNTLVQEIIVNPFTVKLFLVNLTSNAVDALTQISCNAVE